MLIVRRSLPQVRLLSYRKVFDKENLYLAQLKAHWLFLVKKKKKNKKKKKIKNKTTFQCVLTFIHIPHIFSVVVKTSIKNSTPKSGAENTSERKNEGASSIGSKKTSQGLADVSLARR